MIWFLSLHIAALLIWCAALLYLPPLIAGNYSCDAGVTRRFRRHNSIARFIFTHVATPSALVAIIAGTVVFWLNHSIEVWLLAKLTAVTLLVVGHTLTGLLILRAERADDYFPLVWRCRALAAFFIIIMAIILWLVLAKPASGVMV